MTASPVTSRHDFTQTTRDLLNYAVRIEAVDAVELAVLVVEHGTDVDAILEEVTNSAFACRHHAGQRHTLWADALDAYRVVQPAEREGDSDAIDRFRMRLRR